MEAADRMPGDAEAAGAAAGMRETYGGRVFAVGDLVSGRTDGRHWSGRIEWIQDNPTELVINDGLSLIGRRPEDVTH